MKKFFEIFFISLGVIFFILIIAGAYFFIADPFGIKPLIKSFTGSGTSQVVNTTDKIINSIPAIKNEIQTRVSAPTNTGVVSSTKSPLLNAAQQKALEAVGVDTSKLPTSITPEMEKCFYDALGATRANEIKNGAVPTPVDLFKAKACIK